MKPLLVLYSMIYVSLGTGTFQIATPLLDQLIGTWQVEGKQTFESWSKNSTGYHGQGYKIVDNIRQTTETLQIVKRNNHFQYLATIPDQNEGKTIAFALVNPNDSTLSFENPDHDFPKKIHYAFKNADKILVNVRGADDAGYSYFLLRVEDQPAR